MTAAEKQTVTLGPWMFLSNRTDTEWQVARKLDTGNSQTTRLEYLTDKRGRPATFRSKAEARTALDVLESSK